MLWLQVAGSDRQLGNLSLLGPNNEVSLPRQGLVHGLGLKIAFADLEFKLVSC